MYKKILAIVLALTLILSLGLTGCKKTPPADTGEKTSDEAVKKIKIGLVTDVGGIDDKSFNQGTWEGIQKFSNDTGAETKYMQSESDTDYIPNLSTYSDENLDLIVAPGFLFKDSIAEVAKNFTEQHYLIIDDVVEAPNVASAVFAEEQGSFLVGVAAGLKAKEAGKTKVGFIGGMDFELIQKFEAGFEAGVKAVDPAIEVMIEYAGSFANAQQGQTIAAKMYDAGAYVVYHAAGATGNGLIKEAKDRVANGNDVWAIGVDKDQYDDGIYADGKSVMLTSMMKRVDVAAYDVAQLTLKGEFPGGKILTFSLENGGVGLPAKNPNLSEEMLKTIADYEVKVKAKEITVPTAPERLKK